MQTTTAEPITKRRPPLKLASFFAGIGGFDLGFHQAGIKSVYQCEIDSFCSEVLAHHWPAVQRDRDIKEVVLSEIPKADIWSAGFPCQDVSLARARERAGLKGARSGLFYDFAELLGGALPETVLLENVPGLLSSHEGRDFGIVIHTLAELGYGVAWRVLNSKNFGVPQSRQRVYIVGCRDNPERAASILFEPERGTGHLETGRKPGEKTISPFMERASKDGRENLDGSGLAVPKLSFCLSATTGRHTGTDWSRTYVAYDAAARRLTPAECEGLQGFPDSWTLPLGWSDDSTSDSARYHALGNAVSVPVIAWLADRIKASISMPTATETAVGLQSEILTA
ncbi:DNA (cytosine-5-)-methyltransferase [Micrococcaceae bacterium Sec5.7]